LNLLDKFNIACGAGDLANTLKVACCKLGPDLQEGVSGAATLEVGQDIKALTSPARRLCKA
jgi:hypothetical protein